MFHHMYRFNKTRKKMDDVLNKDKTINSLRKELLNVARSFAELGLTIEAIKTYRLTTEDGSLKEAKDWADKIKPTRKVLSTLDYQLYKTLVKLISDWKKVTETL